MLVWAHAFRCDGTQHDQAGFDFAARLVDGLDGSVNAEEGDAPAARAERQPKGDQAEVVLLTGQTREHGRRPEAQSPTPTEPEKPPAQHAGGEVLLRDRGVAAFPALPEFA